MTATRPRGRASTDDPRVMLDEQIGVFEPVPPYPPRTEREAEFYTLGDGEMFINMGPQHPSTHGVLRVVLKLDGEKVVDLDPVLGYLHRGVEKLCENADYHQAICYLDPLEYVSSLFCEWPGVMAFEKLLDERGLAGLERRHGEAGIRQPSVYELCGLQKVAKVAFYFLSARAGQDGD